MSFQAMQETAVTSDMKTQETASKLSLLNNRKKWLLAP